MVGFNFNKIGGEKTDFVEVASDGMFLDYQCLNGDAFYVFNSEFFNYDTYTYMDGLGWICTPGDGETPDYPMDGFAFNTGDDFMLYPYDPEACKFSIAGEVAPSGKQTITFDLNDDYIFPLSNPFPIDTKLSDLTFAGNGDALYVFNPEVFNYDTYTYMTGLGWICTPGDGETPDYSVDDDLVVLKAGQGGMLYPYDSRVWEVTLNY